MDSHALLKPPIPNAQAIPPTKYRVIPQNSASRPNIAKQAISLFFDGLPSGLIISSKKNNCLRNNIPFSTKHTLF